mmetsp:Transcript_23115/g.64924  ORF Transcript_23115/g.64924 Transcript_23115/m.64924 type:complete len:182 (-) Transcript_23115:237-782(-)
MYEGDGNDDDRGCMTSSGDWTVLYFYHNFDRKHENCQKFPVLMDTLKQLGPDFLGGMVCFSCIVPGTHIVPHTGPSNMRLTCHLGITGCEDVQVQVGTERRYYEDGKCVVFDDSYIHEVVHRGDRRRITLMLDLWNPNVTTFERESWVEVMQNAMKDKIPPELFFHSLNLYNIKEFKKNVL